MTAQQARCYQCRDEPARPGSRFCSESCAAVWAEAFAHTLEDAWCPQCNDWLEQPHRHGM